MSGQNVIKMTTPKRRKETPEYAEMVRRILRAYGRRVSAGDVEDLTTFREVIDRAEEDLAVAVHGLRAQGHSWADIGRGLGMPRQNAYRRFARASSSGMMDAGPNQEDPCS